MLNNIKNKGIKLALAAAVAVPSIAAAENSSSQDFLKLKWDDSRFEYEQRAISAHPSAVSPFSEASGSVFGRMLSTVGDCSVGPVLHIESRQIHNSSREDAGLLGVSHKCKAVIGDEEISGAINIGAHRTNDETEVVPAIRGEISIPLRAIFTPWVK